MVATSLPDSNPSGTVRKSLPAFHGNAIHVGRLGRFDRRLPAEFGEGFVGGAVGDDDGVFHGLSLSPGIPSFAEIARWKGRGEGL